MPSMAALCRLAPAIPVLALDMSATWVTRIDLAHTANSAPGLAASVVDPSIYRPRSVRAVIQLPRLTLHAQSAAHHADVRAYHAC